MTGDRELEVAVGTATYGLEIDQSRDAKSVSYLIIFKSFKTSSFLALLQFSVALSCLEFIFIANFPPLKNTVHGKVGSMVGFKVTESSHKVFQYVH